MKNSTLIGTLMMLTGVYLLWCGIKNYNPIDTLKNLLTKGTSSGGIGESLGKAFQNAQSQPTPQQTPQAQTGGSVSV